MTEGTLDGIESLALLMAWLKVPLTLGSLEIVGIEDLITVGSELGIGNAPLVVMVEVLVLGKTLGAVSTGIARRIV